MQRQAKTYWSHRVKTVSTFPPPGTFMKDAHSIARIMASKKVSPKGLGSGIRMIQYFINRAGKSLSPTRKHVLERAKRLLQEKSRQQRGKPSAHRSRHGARKARAPRAAP